MTQGTTDGSSKVYLTQTLSAVSTEIYCKQCTASCWLSSGRHSCTEYVCLTVAPDNPDYCGLLLGFAVFSRCTEVLRGLLSAFGRLGSWIACYKFCVGATQARQGECIYLGWSVSQSWLGAKKHQSVDLALRYGEDGRLHAVSSYFGPSLVECGR